MHWATVANVFGFLAIADEAQSRRLSHETAWLHHKTHSTTDQVAIVVALYSNGTVEITRMDNFRKSVVIIFHSNNFTSPNIHRICNSCRNAFHTAQSRILSQTHLLNFDWLTCVSIHIREHVQHTCIMLYFDINLISATPLRLYLLISFQKLRLSTKWSSETHCVDPYSQSI